MKSDQITLILRIAQEGSVSKAAKMLFLSQPTASNMLKSLESELGYPLFERTKSGMIPTQEGYEFIEHAISIERSLQAISRIRRPVMQIDFKIIAIRFEFAELAFEKLCEKYLTGDYAADLTYQNINNTDEAVRMVENGTSDIAIVFCRKNMYESAARSADRKHMETAPIGDIHLELTCRKGHPLIQKGSIAFDLLGSYPCFTSIHTSISERYAPLFLAQYGMELKNSIAMDPSPIRYRLLQKTDGYLVSLPIPDEIRSDYGLETVAIKDSDISVFSVYRKNPLRADLINEYIQYCRSYM